MFHKSPCGRSGSVLLGAIALSMLFSPSAHADVAKGPCTVTKQADVPAKMRDGATLLADVYRPVEGSYPVILMRLPYDKSTAQTYVYASPEFYASHCYIVAIQDVRGQYASQGTFYPFRDEMNDGYDSVEWAAAALPGSNGKVGMYGFSYVGATQWLAAVMQPPHLAAIVPAMTSSDYYDGWSYEGGAWSLAFEESWPIFTIALADARRTGDQAQGRPHVRDECLSARHRRRQGDGSHRA